MAVETNKDDTAIMSGAHTGSNSASDLYHADQNFDVCATVGAVCYNTTQGTSGLITATTVNTVTVTGVTWDTDDLYEIYKTDTKDGYISSFKTTKILGRKWTNWYTDENELDLPDGTFGPGQPERS